MFTSTATGFTTWEACERELRRYAQGLLAGLSDAERLKLHALLTKIKPSKL